LPHPQKQIVPLATIAALCAANSHLILRKYDGEFASVDITAKGSTVTLLCERMRGEISGHHYTAADRAMFALHDGRGGSPWYAALTVATIDGVNFLDMTARDRWAILCGFVPFFPANVKLAMRIESAAGCDTTMDAGAEGLCATAWDDPWGTMLCHKRGEIFMCRVTAIGATQSVGIERVICDKLDMTSSVEAARAWLITHNSSLITSPCGSVTLRGWKCDQVRIGSIIRVEGMGLTAGGKIRQPQPCKEWLVRY
jgi:hypothetical protein